MYEDVDEVDTPAQTAALLAQVVAAQKREELRSPGIERMLVKMPTLVPKVAHGERIRERSEFIFAKVKSPNLSRQACWKIARALEEARIEEYRIYNAIDRLENVSNRGAYFLACAKGAFKAVGLSWLEEEWVDA